MSENSKIEWTDATWNPVLGCDKISPGCKNCYAIRTAWRLQHNPNPKVAKAFEGLTVMQGSQPNWTGRLNFLEERLKEPLGWHKPRRVFVNSQSDLFHDGITDEQIDRIFAVMVCSPQHTFQVLTKRPARMLEYLSPSIGNVPGSARAGSIQLEADKFVGIGTANRRFDALGWPLKNVWMGVSCENQATADERIPLLLQTPAAVRWISAEPLLGPVDLNYWIKRIDHCDSCRAENSPQIPDKCPECGEEGTLISTWGHEQAERYRTGERYDRSSAKGRADVDGADASIDWVVAGGESGPNARPMHPDWARSLRDQCKAAGVPFFFKQWGEFADLSNEESGSALLKKSNHDLIFTATGETLGCGDGKNGMLESDWKERGGAWMGRIGKKAAGRKLDGLEHNEYPKRGAVQG